MLQLEITVGGLQRLMLLFAPWTDDQGTVSSAVPSLAIEQGPEFEIEGTVSGDGASLPRASTVKVWSAQVF